MTIGNRLWTWTAADAPAFAEALRKVLDDGAEGYPAHYPAFIDRWPDDLAPGQIVRRDSAEHWLQDLLAIGRVRKLPNFEEIVKAITATFAVFTGFTITRYLLGDPIEINLSNYGHWRWWGFFALVTLLLRYIIGSAVQLNQTYGGAIPKSYSTLLLFKDLLFLVVFGMIAVYTMKAETIHAFIWRSMLFAVTGLAWSVFDFLIRRMWGRYIQGTFGRARLFRHDLIYCVIVFVLAIAVIWIAIFYGLHGRAASVWVIVFLLTAFALTITDSRFPAQREEGLPEWPAPFWEIWARLDGAQFLLSWGILRLPFSDLSKAILLALFYLAFLYLDMKALNRMLRSG